MLDHNPQIRRHQTFTQPPLCGLLVLLMMVVFMPQVLTMAMDSNDVKRRRVIGGSIDTAHERNLGEVDRHHHPHRHIPPLTSPLSCAAECSTDSVGATSRRHDDEFMLGKASHVGS